MSDIQEWDTTLELITNEGILTTNLKGYVKDIGWVWYHSDDITNIILFVLLEDKYNITYDSKDKDGFIVYMSDFDKVRFKRNKANLYVIDTKNKKTMN